MDLLSLTPMQRLVIQGKFWKQLYGMNRRYPGLKRKVLDTVPELFHRKYSSIIAYELNKFIPFSGIKKYKA